MSPQYIYCILDSGQELQAAGQGLAGRNLSSISYRDVSALVSDVSTVDYNEENILRHEEVIERMMGFQTVLPMRFGTVLESEEKVRAMLAQYYQSFLRNFARLRGRVEMGLKIIWPVEVIKREIDYSVHNPDNRDVTPEQAAGAAYLKEKLKGYRRRKALEEKADRFVQSINSGLDTCFEEYRIRKLVTEKMVLNGAYLVMKDRVEEFGIKIRDFRSRYPESKFLLSGPWPPYNFIELKEG